MNNNLNLNVNVNNLINNKKMDNTTRYIIILVAVFIVTIIIMLLIKYGIEYYNNTKHDSPMILTASKNAKNSMLVSQDPNNEGSVMLYRSDNKSGIEFSYSLWFVIENMEYKFGEWKHMFHKGNKTSYPNRAPGVFIHPDKNALRIYMNTMNNVLEHVDVDNIPLRRWVHLVVSVNHKYFDIYVNGRLKKRHEFTSTPKQNFGDLWINLFGGFEGYMCNMQYFRKAITYQEVESITSKGPSTASCIDGGEAPPYLDDNWWYN